MSEYTPTTEDVREQWGWNYPDYDNDRADFDRWLIQHDQQVRMGLFDNAQVMLLMARAWDEGHKHRWSRGDDGCECAAHSLGECSCGLYGTGELLSLNANPYREDTTHSDHCNDFACLGCDPECDETA